MSYPPFRAAPDRETRNVSSKGGALMLAAEIKQRWAACGVNVHCEVFKAVAREREDDSVFGIRIHGLNGKLSGGV
jgi:hypothetical protein